MAQSVQTFRLHSKHIALRHLMQQYCVFRSFTDGHLLQVFLFAILSSGTPSGRGCSCSFIPSAFITSCLVSLGRFGMVRRRLICGSIKLFESSFKKVNLVITGEPGQHKYKINVLTLQTFSSLQNMASGQRRVLLLDAQMAHFMSMRSTPHLVWLQKQITSGFLFSGFTSTVWCMLEMRTTALFFFSAQKIPKCYCC